ncbi:unnamed protein product [Durusdinium trenchii]|uniref:Uncharacterized protein n=1 Tax=Durusdinium trenchii TaxID=1381693 RepID=A0ABP0MHN3_9DINO
MLLYSYIVTYMLNCQLPVIRVGLFWTPALGDVLTPLKLSRFCKDRKLCPDWLQGSSLHARPAAPEADPAAGPVPSTTHSSHRRTSTQTPWPGTTGVLAVAGPAFSRLLERCNCSSRATALAKKMEFAKERVETSRT